jgi:hypothetical protein
LIYLLSYFLNKNNCRCIHFLTRLDELEPLKVKHFLLSVSSTFSFDQKGRERNRTPGAARGRTTGKSFFKQFQKEGGEKEEIFFFTLLDR